MYVVLSFVPCCLVCCAPLSPCCLGSPVAFLAGSRVAMYVVLSFVHCCLVICAAFGPLLPCVLCAILGSPVALCAVLPSVPWWPCGLGSRLLCPVTSLLPHTNTKPHTLTHSLTHSPILLLVLVAMLPPTFGSLPLDPRSLTRIIETMLLADESHDPLLPLWMGKARS
jgi:hypothetical protein